TCCTFLEGRGKFKTLLLPDACCAESFQHGRRRGLLLSARGERCPPAGRRICSRPPCLNAFQPAASRARSSAASSCWSSPREPTPGRRKRPSRPWRQLAAGPFSTRERGRRRR